MVLIVDGAKLRRLREEAGMTQVDVMVRARELGYTISNSTLTRLENGSTKPVYRNTLKVLSVVLKVQPRSLLLEAQHV